MDIRALVGRNVKRRRIELGLTQEQLAERSGFDQRYISQLETGKQNPTVLSLHELSQALDCKASAFLNEDAKET